jgi:hypothetical protein
VVQTSSGFAGHDGDWAGGEAIWAALATATRIEVAKKKCIFDLFPNDDE